MDFSLSWITQVEHAQGSNKRQCHSLVAVDELLMCLCNISDLVMFLFFFSFPLSPVVHTWLAAPLKSVFSAGKLNKIYNSYIWPRFYFLTRTPDN